MASAPPSANQSIQGYQPFNVISGDGENIGTFYAYESTFPYLAPHQPDAGSGFTSNQTLLVTSDTPGSENGTGTVPADGSVFSTLWLFGHALENVYSAIPAPDGHDVVTDTLLTPVGSLDLTPLFFGLLGFDAADVPSVLPDGIKPADVADSPPAVTAVSGIPPLTIAPQGYQEFDFYGPDGKAGTFGAVTTTTTDVMGFHTEALLVTDDPAGNPGTAAGDVPPVGSVFNTIELHTLPGFQLAYSALPSPDGDEVKTILKTPLGPVDLSFLFGRYDASAGLAGHSPAQPFSFGDGYTIAPAENSPEVFTGINGLPPSNGVIQGNQQFAVYDQDGNSLGTFHADVSTIPNMWISHFSEALLVTDVSGTTGTMGTDPGDIPPVGSVFDVVDRGFGFATIYSDLPAATPGAANVISQIVVTPIGNINLSGLAQGTDASRGLTDVLHAGNAWAGLFTLPAPDPTPDPP